MPDPISFASTAPRFGIPFLIAGQAQKEFFVNEAHALIDLLLHPAIEEEMDTPPVERAEGTCWLVGPDPVSDWTDHAGELAGWVSGSWVFAKPRNGMRIFDLSSQQLIVFSDGWHKAATPALPSGGLVVDTEAREAIANLVQLLGTAGILSAP